MAYFKKQVSKVGEFKGRPVFAYVDHMGNVVQCGPFGDLDFVVQKFCEQGDKVSAIKFARVILDLGLKEAKDLIDPIFADVQTRLREKREMENALDRWQQRTESQIEEWRRDTDGKLDRITKGPV